MVIDGFWLPQALRSSVLADARWDTAWLQGGRLLTAEAPNAVAIRWPRLDRHGWQALLDGLRRARAVDGREVLARWQTVLGKVRSQLVERSPAMLEAIAACTGYSQEMLAAALWQGDIVDPRLLPAALEFQPRRSAAWEWERMPGLPGQVRFYPESALERVTARFTPGALLGRPASPVSLALGYAAGNVPGTALLIGLLASLANWAHSGQASPAVLIRNSRHEPIFAPWVLGAIEEIDPELVAGLAVLVWDYGDGDLQRDLMSQAGLMMAAAGDETIAALDAIRRRAAPGLRFHRHGHKVSLSAVQHPCPDMAPLAALDSALWDQNGCLSARVHFIEGDAEEWAAALARAMRALASALPRGTTPRRFVHRAFDTFAALQARGEVRVFSTYADDFAVVLDRRKWQAGGLSRAANACAGRVIVVRPIQDILQVPELLGELPPGNLQSASVIMDQGIIPAFAQAAGARGVTAIRSLGRAAFPQLAYSWDGLLPIDVCQVCPAGRFMTIEFDDLGRELAETYMRWSGLLKSSHNLS